MPFQGNLPDLMLQRIMGKAAWQPLCTGSYPASMQMLLAGKADLALLAEPMASAALIADPGLSRVPDLCTLWQTATALDRCPSAGAMLATSGLPQRSGVPAGLEEAFARCAEDPGLAHDLVISEFPDLAAGRGAKAYSGIPAGVLALPADQLRLNGLFSEIYTIAPNALGGALPAQYFYSGGTAP